MSDPKSKSKKVLPPEYPKVWETFGPPYIPHHGKEEPSCFNGMVSVERYRVTIEKIDEPREAVAERILKLWKTCDNHHHRGPLQGWAERFGLTLDWKDYGKDVKP